MYEMSSAQRMGPLYFDQRCFHAIRCTMKASTPVKVLLDDGTFWHTLTRSEPWKLGHGQWVVMLAGKSGGYDLARVYPVQWDTVEVAR